MIVIPSTLALLFSLAATAVQTQVTLVADAGQKVAIPSWDIQSTSKIEINISNLSLPSVDTSSWYHINSSRCTIMGCLLNAGVYKDSNLWFSDTLRNFDKTPFAVPWVYRNEFRLPEKTSQHHFLLETNGISSRADLFVNGQLIANKVMQDGSYAGYTYDITNFASQENTLAISVYPVNYKTDLAIDFLDWNPPSPDNNMGVWRDVSLRHTGAVALGPLRVLTDIETPVQRNPATIKVSAVASNLELNQVTAFWHVVITDPSGITTKMTDQTITLGPGEAKTLIFTHKIQKPAIWWPKSWGDQPLYSAKMSVSVGSSISDLTESKFGIRTISSAINKHNDTQFTVNGHAFQVVGGGYSPDMFLRWDAQYFTAIVKYMLDMGQNTIRLEGKMEQPELYEIADRLGLMVMAGWECCSKWEAWPYNHDVTLSPWGEIEYTVANASIIHEVAMMQTHPSMLAFLVGSDSWPDDRATKIYIDAFKAAGWQIPIIASAAKRGYPAALGPAGLKMEGPYDWVPPNYWYNNDGIESNRFGAAFGFGSELGAGVGTPELGSLKRFLSQSDMDDLWKQPDKKLWHASKAGGKFDNRKIYNAALLARYGRPTTLDNYLIKSQLMDYEATRAQHEAFGAYWNEPRPATGLIYWMLNNAWPELHWNQFDYYLHPAGSFFGTKAGLQAEQVAYNYQNKTLWLINRTLNQRGVRAIDIEVMDLSGTVISKQSIQTTTIPNTSKMIGSVNGFENAPDVVLARVILSNSSHVLSRNVYWICTKTTDVLDWTKSTYYYTPVTKYVNYTLLNEIKPASVDIEIDTAEISEGIVFILHNTSDIPAFFVILNLVDANDDDVVPITWSDNYVTIWPDESIRLVAQYGQKTGLGFKLQIRGFNIQADSQNISLSL